MYFKKKECEFFIIRTLISILNILFKKEKFEYFIKYLYSMFW